MVSACHVLAVGAASYVLAMGIVSACISLIRCRGCRLSVRTTFETFQRNGPLMVPLQSAALVSMCGTILAAVDRHHSLRSTGITPLHVNLGAHVLVLCFQTVSRLCGPHLTCSSGWFSGMHRAAEPHFSSQPRVPYGVHPFARCRCPSEAADANMVLARIFLRNSVRSSV